MTGFVYVLKMNNWKCYIWSTKDLQRRISEHMRWNVYSTKNNRPLELIFYKKFENIGIAHKKELWLKNQKSRKIIELFISDS